MANLGEGDTSVFALLFHIRKWATLQGMTAHSWMIGRHCPLFMGKETLTIHKCQEMDD